MGFTPDQSTMGIIGELNTSIPGIDEAMCLAYIMKITQQMEFKCVVFDTAPTGHTLKLLSFPNILGKALEKLIQLKEKFGGIISSVIYYKIKIPLNFKIKILDGKSSLSKS